jgi:hypothetical protein
MKTSIIKLSLLGLLAVAVAGSPICASAKSTNAPAVKETKPKKSGSLPFHGKLKSVDQNTKTIAVGEQTIQITSDTKITKAGKPATLEEGTVGEEVAGAYKKTDDGKSVATSVKFGAKAEKATKPVKKEEKK